MSRMAGNAVAGVEVPGAAWTQLDEMVSARRVQARLLAGERRAAPATGPSGLECAGLCLQDRGVGGDFWDVAGPFPDRLVLTVGDVSGKGVPAALMMAALQAILRTHHALHPGDLASRLASVNRLFAGCTSAEHYASLFIGEYLPATGRLVYANCGHVAPVVLRRDLRVEILPPTGMVLGMFDEWKGGTSEIGLAPGDLLLAVSDGVTEAAGPAGGEFGLRGLVAALEARRDQRAAALVRGLADDVRRFSAGRQADDLTRRAARAPAPRPPSGGAEAGR
jgi:serine phosphatase RsbU (regulator of sigma subunit)